MDLSVLETMDISPSEVGPASPYQDKQRPWARVVGSAKRRLPLKLSLLLLAKVCRPTSSRM